MNRNTWLVLCALLLSIVLVSCGGGDDEIVGTGGKIEAAAHKGPFIIGSNVTVNVLTQRAAATDKTIITSTADDLGNFSFQLDDVTLMQIKVSGYYFDEVSGALSSGPATLNAVHQNTDSTPVFVNLLTHLINNRIINLIATGATFETATQQAQTELISALDGIISIGEVNNFTRLSVFNLQGTDELGNAYLLALSAIMSKYAQLQSDLSGGSASAVLSQTLNTLASDFADDGEFENGTILQGLSEAMTQLNPDLVEQNLINRSIEVRGEALPVPDINQFIDTDRDGKVNSVDNDDDGDNIVDDEDPSPYVPNNQERLSMAIGSNAEIEFVEKVDESTPLGYETKMTVAYDETKLFEGSLSPVTVVKLLHYETDSRLTELRLNIFANQAGTYAVKSQARLKYISQIGNDDNVQPYFDYRGASGFITIDQYGGVGEYITGSYQVTANCRGDYQGCNLSDSISLSGRFKVSREENYLFRSVGSAVNPIDLGGLPLPEFWSTDFDGENINMVAAGDPSHYRLAANSLDQFKISVVYPSSSIILRVYDSEQFDSLVCESTTSAQSDASCNVSPVNDHLYFSVTLLGEDTSGAWYGIGVNLSANRDEGSASQPLDISEQEQYQGQVGELGSYYRINVNENTKHHISLVMQYEYVNLEVYDDATFSNKICTTYNDSCNIIVPSGVSQLYIRVPPRANGAEPKYYTINHGPIVGTEYVLEIHKTLDVPDYSLCAAIEIYQSDATTPVVELQKGYSACIDNHAINQVVLESGKTYYLKMIDTSSHYQKPVDYYAIHFGLNAYSDTWLTTTPDENLNEPGDNASQGAIELTPNQAYYSSLDSSDSDVDWYKITLP